MKKSIWLEPRAIVSYALSLLALAEMVDLSIVSFAIPQMMSSLNTNLDNIAMVSTGYIVAAAIFTPLTGIAVRKFSMRALVLVTSGVFCIASVLCGLAQTLPEMVFFRIIQGIGGAFLPSIAQAYVEKTFSGTPLAKPMLTIFGAIIVLGPILGSVLGGFLTAELNWRFIFFVNVPVCMAGFVLVVLFMERDEPQKVKVAYTSFALMALGVGALEYFIDQGNSHGWFSSMTMLIIFTISMVSLFFFVWLGCLGSAVINFGLFNLRHSNFLLNIFVVFAISVIGTAGTAYYPTMLQQIYNYPVDTAGYITSPRGVIVILTAPIAALLSNIIGSRETMLIGFLIFASGSIMIGHSSPVPSFEQIIVSTVLQGIGMMGIFIPLLQLCNVGITPSEREDASGIFNFFRTFGVCIGYSASATSVSYQFNVCYHDLAAKVSPYANGYGWWVQNLVGLPDDMKIAVANMQVLVQSALLSYLDIFYSTGIIILCLFWLPFVLQPPEEEQNSLVMMAKSLCYAGYLKLISLKKIRG